MLVILLSVNDYPTLYYIILQRARQTCHDRDVEFRREINAYLESVVNCFLITRRNLGIGELAGIVPSGDRGFIAVTIPLRTQLGKGE
jgi:hypothetical protein